jgi:O-succinylbenzoate synthase
LIVYSIPLKNRFRGIDRREGVLIKGDAGWSEWSPFLEYGPDEAKWWWRAAMEAAEFGFPEAVRESIPVNVTVPVISPDAAYALVEQSGCSTAKVKVADPGSTLAQDMDRVEAVRAALGPSGFVRVDANGAWELDEAVHNLRELGRFDLQYAEQPVRATEDLAELRLRLARLLIDIPIAADESIRKAQDPYLVKRLDAADIAVLKVQPLGGVRRCLQIASDLGLPVVVSSAIETSVGLRMGVALAAALPDLDFACGLGTATMLTQDVVADPLVPVDGMLPVRDVEVQQGDWLADAETTARWERRADSIAG